MLGFLIVLLAAVFFCCQNVIVKVLFSEHPIFGIFQTGGFVEPTLQNSFLLMFMRMALVVPLMSSLTFKLYPSTWSDLRHLAQPDRRPLLLRSLGCGGLMFLYLALLYVAIGLIPTGIALTLFFTYPIFTALFSWYLFGCRPTWFRASVMVLILFGSFLTVPYQPSATSHNGLIGVGLGLASGVAYALYTVFAQKSLESFHPVPFTWISFVTTLALSAVCLLFWPLPDVSLAWTPLWIGGLLSAIVTFAGHLMNNFGIQLIGATAAAMIGASNPALTVVLAWFAIQETLNPLQLAGVGLVTLSVALLSQERRFVK